MSCMCVCVCVDGVHGLNFEYAHHVRTPSINGLDSPGFSGLSCDAQRLLGRGARGGAPKRRRKLSAFFRLADALRPDTSSKLACGERFARSLAGCRRAASQVGHIARRCLLARGSVTSSTRTCARTRTRGGFLYAKSLVLRNEEPQRLFL